MRRGLQSGVLIVAVEAMTRTCAGWSHERLRDQWLDPHDVLPLTAVE